MRAHDLTGMTFGRFTAIERDISYLKKDARWVCQCSCGAIKSVMALSLKNGSSSSCGCLRDELAKKRATTHSLTKTPEHRTWGSMIQRCTNKNHHAFHNYGGRGIKICHQWRTDFLQFLSDMGKRPEGTTLDRIDVNGDYEPSNCRWATETQQKNNRRDNRYIEWEGETYTLSNLARKYGLTYNILFKRLNANTPIGKALTMPVRVTNRYHIPLSSISKQ